MAANSAMRQVVPFSRTTNISFSGLVERPERFSTSCSAVIRAIVSAGGKNPIGSRLREPTRLVTNGWRSWSAGSGMTKFPTAVDFLRAFSLT